MWNRTPFKAKTVVQMRWVAPCMSSDMWLVMWLEVRSGWTDECFIASSTQQTDFIINHHSLETIWRRSSMILFYETRKVSIKQQKCFKNIKWVIWTLSKQVWRSGSMDILRRLMNCQCELSLFHVWWSLKQNSGREASTIILFTSPCNFVHSMSHCNIGPFKYQLSWNVFRMEEGLRRELESINPLLSQSWTACHFWLVNEANEGAPTVPPLFPSQFKPKHWQCSRS